MTKVEVTSNFELIKDSRHWKNCLGMQFLIIQLKALSQNFQKAL